MSSFGTLFRVTTFGESHCAGGRRPAPREPAAYICRARALVSLLFVPRVSASLLLLL